MRIDEDLEIHPRRAADAEELFALIDAKLPARGVIATRRFLVITS